MYLASFALMHIFLQYVSLIFEEILNKQFIFDPVKT